MGFFSTKEQLLQPSKSRIAFLFLAMAAYGFTELGRFVYRPYVWENGLNDLGLADCIGNLGGIGVQILFGLAVLNPNQKQSYRLAVFFALGYIVYEFAQLYLPKGVFDWKDIYGTVIGFLVSVLVVSGVWKIVGSDCNRESGSGTESGRIA